MALSLNDIVALAKAGYKPSDVKEIISMNTDNDTPVENKPSEPVTEEPTAVTESENVTQQPEETKKEPEEVLQYKKQIEELQKKLQDAQQANVKANVKPADVKTDFDECVDIMSSFL